DGVREPLQVGRVPAPEHIEPQGLGHDPPPSCCVVVETGRLCSCGDEQGQAVAFFAFFAVARRPARLAGALTISTFHWSVSSGSVQMNSRQVSEWSARTAAR